MNYKHKTTGTQAKLAEDGKYYIHNCSIGIPKQFIEDSRIWEKEDGYEILSLITKNRHEIIHKVGYTFPECFQTLVKANDIFDIHSVKRLNDGAVFTIGDKVNKGYYIKSFKISDAIHNPGLLVRADLKGEGALINFPIKDIEKCKTPLFKTQEGDDIFEGDSYWCVNTTPHLWSVWEQTSKERTMLNKNVLAFSSEISAKKYIKENKPQYSLNDIRNVLTKQMECTNWIMIDVDKIIKDLEK